MAKHERTYQVRTRGPGGKTAKVYLTAKSQKAAEKKAAKVSSRLNGGTWEPVQSQEY